MSPSLLVEFEWLISGLLLTFIFEFDNSFWNCVACDFFVRSRVKKSVTSEFLLTVSWTTASVFVLRLVNSSLSSLAWPGGFSGRSAGC